VHDSQRGKNLGRMYVVFKHDYIYIEYIYTWLEMFGCLDFLKRDYIYIEMFGFLKAWLEMFWLEMFEWVYDTHSKHRLGPIVESVFCLSITIAW
jgi:hypothetical protein